MDFRAVSHHHPHRSRSFNALVAPRKLFIGALNRSLNLQRFRVLYVTGIYSGILSRLDRRFSELEIWRGFTVFQLMAILEVGRRSLILVEHDPMRYGDASEMTEYVSGALKQAAQEADVLLFASGVHSRALRPQVVLKKILGILRNGNGASIHE